MAHISSYNWGGALDTRLSTPTMLSAPLGAELQLRGDDGDAEGCALGCQAELPPPTKLHYLGWLVGCLTGPKAQWGPKDMVPSCLRPKSQH